MRVFLIYRFAKLILLKSNISEKNEVKNQCTIEWACQMSLLIITLFFDISVKLLGVGSHVPSSWL